MLYKIFSLLHARFIVDYKNVILNRLLKINYQEKPKGGFEKSQICFCPGLIGMTACSLVVSFLLSDLRTSDDQNCPGINLDKYPWTNYLSVTLLFIYLIFFAIGPSCVPWMLTPELFTVGTVSTAASIAGIVNWLANFSVQFGFGTLLDYLCGWVFLIFVGFMSFFIVYLKIHLPETKGMAITEIVALFE